PLSEDDLAKENRRLEKRIKEIEKKEAEKDKKTSEAPDKGDKGEEPDEEDRRVTISQVLRASLLTNPRPHRFRPRDVIVFDFKPTPNYKPKTDNEKLMQKAAGVVWIDSGDRQVARLEATLVDTLSFGGGMMFSIKPGGGFVLEQDRINNELWLPSYAEFNFAARALMFVGLSISQTIKYGDYKRFSVESEREKLKPQ